MSGIIEAITAEHLDILSTKLGHLYHLQPSLEVARANPRQVAWIWGAHVQLVHESLSLSPSERGLVQRVSWKMEDKPSKSAADLLRGVARYECEILKAVEASGNPETEAYHLGVDNLAVKMTAGWQMKVENLKPADGDPRSDRVIWGHVNGAVNPWIDVYFTVAHLIEQVTTVGLEDSDVSVVTSHKDWLLNIMTAGLAIGMAKCQGAGYALKHMWRDRRPYGLGWISPAREDAYLQSWDRAYQRRQHKLARQ